MIRRGGLVLSALLGAVVLSSCGTVSDRVATVNGRDISYDAFKAYAETNSGGSGVPQSGEETRRLLAQMIGERLDPQPVAADAAQTVYETGFAGSPLVCIGVILLADPAKADEVKNALQSGTALADVASSYGSDQQEGNAPGGVLSAGGNECYPPSVLNSEELTASLAAVKVGEGVDFDAGGVPVVVLLRPWDTLQPESQQQVATSLGRSAALSAADVVIDSKYGRWNTATGTVVADR